MKEEILKEIRRVATILVIGMFVFTMLIVFALCIEIDKLDAKIEQLK